VTWTGSSLSLNARDAERIHPWRTQERAVQLRALVARGSDSRVSTPRARARTLSRGPSLGVVWKTRVL